MRTLWWAGDALCLIDQLKLPHEEVVLTCRDYLEVARAIVRMNVRGAPAIGVSAAYGVALAALRGPEDAAALRAHVADAAAALRAARPTAVNLGWAMDRMLRRLEALRDADAAGIRVGLLAEADRMAAEDEETNRRIGRFGADLVPDGANILTHCNTGALATVAYGTALGVVRAAHEAGKRIHVYVDETRPYLQGARLTAYELQQEGIPFTLITDNMAGHFLKSSVDLVVVGADRIAANGDVANKIGTYGVAVIAHENRVPFYVAAPRSTIDIQLASGEGIPIEERSQEEVTHIGGVRIAPQGTHAAHPAFDVTPARYVSAIITEVGALRPPYDESLARATTVSAEESLG